MDTDSSPPTRSPKRRWRQSHSGTVVVAVAALVVFATVSLFLITSGTTTTTTTTGVWHRFKYWQVNPLSFSSADLPLFSSPPLPSPFTPNRNRCLSVSAPEELSLKHVVFGIAGSSQLWQRRKEFVRLWWRPEDMRGHVWLDEQVPPQDGDDSLPPIMVSEDISRFHYTNPTGQRSGLRISRIVAECFRLGLPEVRWIVLGDDDTIFNADNLIFVLSKYDPSHMVYIGSPSESHNANTYFSHSMAYGGGGIAISNPLAEALSKIQDQCLEKYPQLYGSDDRLHACITELGVPLTMEHGFHQWDIRGSAHGLLSSHPIAPFISIHHVEAVDPFYPGLSTLESLKLFAKAMRVQPLSFLQRSICYDHARRLTFSVSLGYVVQVFPSILRAPELERSERTYSPWIGINGKNEFDIDTRDPFRSICKKPILFFLKDIGKEGNSSSGLYVRVRGKDDWKRRVFCFPRPVPIDYVQNIQVLSNPLSRSWHLVPRRLCCQINQSGDKLLKLMVGQCQKEVSSVAIFM